MIVYISDPKSSIRNFLELTNNYSKVAGYKINSKEKIKTKSLLYTNDKCTEKEIKDTIPFTIASNNIKHLVILTKQVKDLSNLNF